MPGNALVLPILLYLCGVTYSLSLSAEQPGNAADKIQIAKAVAECPADGVTNCMNNQGFGSQFNQIAGTLRYSVEHQKTFCPSGFSKNGIHSLQNDKAWKFIGGAQYGPPAKSDTECKKAPGEEFGCASINGQRVRSNNLVRTAIHDHYMSAKKPELNLLKNDTTNIAWHIRRGDRTKTIGQETYYGYELTNQDVIASMQTLSDLLTVKHPSRRTHFMFFSEGKKEDFAEIQEKCNVNKHVCTFLLDSSQWESAFHHFVMADVFVTASISNFSRAAAYLREAKKRPTYDSFDLLTRKMSQSDKTKMGWAKIMEKHAKAAGEKVLDLTKVKLDTQQRRYNCTATY